MAISEAGERHEIVTELIEAGNYVAKVRVEHLRTGDERVLEVTFGGAVRLVD